MTDYYIYNNAGVILQTGSTSNAVNLSEIWCPPNTWIAEGTADHQKHYVKNHQLCELTEFEQEIYLSQPWRRHEFNFESMAYADSRSIEDRLNEAKILKWEEIKIARAEADYSPYIFNDLLFDADLNSQQKISSILQTCQFQDESWSIEWTIADNSVAVLSRSQIIVLALSLAERTDQIYKKARLIRVAINSAVSLEEVAAITWVTFS